MKLSQRAIYSFQNLYLKYFDQALDEETAQEKAMHFLNFFKYVYRPVPVDHRAVLEAYRVS